MGPARDWAGVGGPEYPEPVTDERGIRRGSTTRDGFGVLGVAIRREPWIFTLSTIGSLLFGALVAVLAIIYLASVFGPPPPSEQALAITGLLGWLFVAWGYWIDRHRVPRAAI